MIGCWRGGGRRAILCRTSGTGAGRGTREPVSKSGHCPRHSEALLSRAMYGLLHDLHAFLQEHRRCGEMDGGVEEGRVWMTCDCGAEIAQPIDRQRKDS